jgi:hypothetical protein
MPYLLSPEPLFTALNTNSLPEASVSYVLQRSGYADPPIRLPLGTLMGFVSNYRLRKRIIGRLTSDADTPTRRCVSPQR